MNLFHVDGFEEEESDLYIRLREHIDHIDTLTRRVMLPPGRVMLPPVGPGNWNTVPPVTDISAGFSGVLPPGSMGTETGGLSNVSGTLTAQPIDLNVSGSLIDHGMLTGLENESDFTPIYPIPGEPYTGATISVYLDDIFTTTTNISYGVAISEPITGTMLMPLTAEILARNMYAGQSIFLRIHGREEPIFQETIVITNISTSINTLTIPQIEISFRAESS